MSEIVYWPYKQVRPKTSNNPTTRRIQPAQKVSIKFTQYIPALNDNKSEWNIFHYISLWLFRNETETTYPSDAWQAKQKEYDTDDYGNGAPFRL